MNYTGRVRRADKELQSRLARRVAWAHHGRMQPPSSATAVSDIGIAKRCRTVIDRLGPFPNVRISVSHGWVSLAGRVGQATYRWKVEHAVGQLDELVGVSAQIKVDAAG